MEGSTKFIIGIVLIAVLGLPLLGQLAKKPAAPAPAAAPTAPSTPATPPPAPVYTPEPPQPSEEQAPVPQQSMPRQGRHAQQPQQSQQPMDLSNTAWTLSHPQYGEVTIELFPGGQGVAQGTKLPMQIQGTWRQTGNSLTFNAMGQTISAQIQNGQLIANGMAAQRLR